MNTAGKLTAYGVALVLVAAGAWATGSAVGPLAVEAETHGAEGAGHGDDHSGAVAGAEQLDQPGGLASSRGGYTLTPTATTLAAGANQPFTFRITGPDSLPVTAFDVEHEKRLHLIVVRRDTSGFQHVHPELSADGTWATNLDLSRPGSYRAFADFKPSGAEPLELGVDVAVPGDFQPDTHRPSRVAKVDGYEVPLDGELAPGSSSKVTATVTRAGLPVTDLQPYLGAYGHLVALRSGDLAYLHVHPDGAPQDGRTPSGPAVTFHAEVPTAATYRLFLDFRHGDVVRTAEFTVPTGREEHTDVEPDAPTHGHG